MRKPPALSTALRATLLPLTFYLYLGAAFLPFLPRGPFPSRAGAPAGASFASGAGDAAAGAGWAAGCAASLWAGAAFSGCFVSIETLMSLVPFLPLQTYRSGLATN